MNQCPIFKQGYTEQNRTVSHEVVSLEEEGCHRLTILGSLQVLGQTQLLSAPKMQNKD